MFSRGCCRRQNESSSTESGVYTFLQKVFGKGIPGIAEVDGPWPEIGRSSIPQARVAKTNLHIHEMILEFCKKRLEDLVVQHQDVSKSAP